MTAQRYLRQSINVLVGVPVLDLQLHLCDGDLPTKKLTTVHSRGMNRCRCILLMDELQELALGCVKDVRVADSPCLCPVTYRSAPTEKSYRHRTEAGEEVHARG
jgi:hypothetical protein